MGEENKRRKKEEERKKNVATAAKYNVLSITMGGRKNANEAKLKKNLYGAKRK